MGSILRAFLSIGLAKSLPWRGITPRKYSPYLAHPTSRRAPTGERQAIFDTFGIFEYDLGKHVHGGERPSQGGCTAVVDSTAIRRVAGLGSAPNLSAFSAMVHLRPEDRYKLFLRLGIGDGAFPKSAKMRQKAPFGGAIHDGRRSA
jgi:hypothetical protein